MLCYAVALVLGLPFSLSVLRAVLAILPAAVLYIAIGLLSGSLLNDKQVGGLCGALLTNVSVICSGAWFPIDLVGKGFRAVCYAMPFSHAVDLGRCVLSGTSDGFGVHLAVVCAYALVLSVQCFRYYGMEHLSVVCGYAVVISVLAVFAFRRAAKRG